MAARLCRLLDRVGLPTDIPVSAEELAPYLLHDKKMQGDEIVTVYVSRPGEFAFRRERAADILRRLTTENA